MSRELISKLVSASGPAGSETYVREILSDLIRPYVDEVTEDVLGNLIAYKKGASENGKTILLEANMDETGIMVIHIEENGFVRIVPLGDVNPVSLIGERIRFTNQVWGVVAVEASKSLKDITFAELFIDIGADSQAEAENRLSIGTAGVVDKGFVELSKDRVIGKSLDNRVGCGVIVDVISKLDTYDHNLIVVFAVQKEVGSRGIKAAAFKTEADLALTIGTARAGDTPKSERCSLQLGKGPAIKVMDNGVIVPPVIKEMLIETAEKQQIPYQLEVSPNQTSDAGTILLTRGGIPTGCISVPIRYPQSSSQVVDLNDAELASRLVLESLRSYK